MTKGIQWLQLASLWRGNGVKTSVPAALSRLTAALDAEKTAPPAANKDADADEPVVSMASRGLPLVNLLTAAAKAECNAMWK
ncbi:MAG: DUF1840 family protein [Sulfuriferula sp.]